MSTGEAGAVTASPTVIGSPMKTGSPTARGNLGGSESSGNSPSSRAKSEGLISMDASSTGSRSGETGPDDGDDAMAEPSARTCALRCCDLKLLAEKHRWHIGQYRLPALCVPAFLAPEWYTCPDCGHSNQMTSFRGCWRMKKSRPSSSIRNGSSIVFGPSTVMSKSGHDISTPSGPRRHHEDL